MTTTGLTKYRGVVSSLNPRIVMIEEPAEMLEAPAAAACFESLQQLILVGDHKQLRGHCALHDLTGEPFSLDVSMFERLVRNDMPFVKLREQRGMAPEIRRLLKPIYGALIDPPSVREYPPIPDMGEVRSWFFTHHWPESGDSLSSKTNELEAVMIVELSVPRSERGRSGENHDVDALQRPEEAAAQEYEVETKSRKSHPEGFDGRLVSRRGE